MSNEKTLSLMVCATNQCNRGCSHCMVRNEVNATVNGSSFAESSWVQKLTREAKELGYFLFGSISGLGEPLMHSEIDKLAMGFSGQGICRRVSFTTSGFLEKDNDERARFGALINLPIQSIMKYSFSFNLYSPSYPERIQETLGALFKQEGASYSDIRIVCDINNYFNTFVELVNTLVCLETKIGMYFLPFTPDYTHHRYKSDILKFLDQEYTRDKETQLAGDAFFLPYIYRVESEKYGNKAFRMYPSFAVQVGSAKNLPDPCFLKSRFHCPLFFPKKEDGHDVSLYMDPKGDMYPACNCMLGGLNNLNR